MAVSGFLEKKEKRQFIDDYIPLRCVALTSRVLPSHVVRATLFICFTLLPRVLPLIGVFNKSAEGP